MNYLADVNVWLAMALIGHVHQEAAQRWFEAPDTQLIAFCRITQNGFLRLLTNPHVMGANVVSAPEAWRLYDAFCQDSRVKLLNEPHDLEAAWRAQTTGHHKGPNFWTDAYLAAFASAADLTVVTFDRGFARRKGVDVRVLA